MIDLVGFGFGVGGLVCARLLIVGASAALMVRRDCL